MKSAIRRVLAAGLAAGLLVACGDSSDNPLDQGAQDSGSAGASAGGDSAGGDSSAGEDTSASADASSGDEGSSAGAGGTAASDGGTAGSEGSGSASGSITLYTSQPDTDVAAMVEAYNKSNPDVKVDVFRSGTEEVLSKLQAEAQAGSPQADVIFIADALSMEGLQSDGLLQPYSSGEAADIDAQYIDPEDYYTGTKIITTGIAINTEQVTTEPTSWSVLTEPDAKGKAEMPSPLYSGAAAYNVSVMAADPDFGWDFWQQIADNDMTVTKGNGSVLKDVASGSKAYGMVVGFIVARAAAEGSPVKFIYPEEGVPVITEPIALAADSQNPDAAKDFIDFVLSEAGQEVESQLGYVPVRPGAPVPEGLKSVDDLTVIEGDTDALFGSVAADKEKFKTMFSQ